jgi:hypothetical protein
VAVSDCLRLPAGLEPLRVRRIKLHTGMLSPISTANPLSRRSVVREYLQGAVWVLPTGGSGGPPRSTLRQSVFR